MATAINFDVSKSNNKSHIENKSYNAIVHNQEEFLNNTNFLLEDVKREYQELSLNDVKDDNKFEHLSSKEKGFYLDEQYVKNNINQKKSLNEISYASRAIENAQSNDSYPTDSLSDLFNEVKNSIISGKEDYLDVLKDVFSKYMEYIKDLREALSTLSQNTIAGSKDGYIHVYFKSFYDELSKVKDKYQNGTQGDHFFFYHRVFGQHQDNEQYLRTIDGNKIYYSNEEQLDKALRSIEDLLKGVKGINSSRNNQSVAPDVDNVFIAVIDFSDLDKFMKEVFDRSKDNKDMLQTEFDLFKKTLDALEKRVNTNLDELSKKYSAANSNYDNFVKIVSSTMNTLLEMAKGFLRF